MPILSLSVAYLTTRVEDTNKVQAVEIKFKLESSITFKQKSDNVAGLRIADSAQSGEIENFAVKIATKRKAGWVSN